MVLKDLRETKSYEGKKLLRSAASAAAAFPAATFPFATAAAAATIWREQKWDKNATMISLKVA